MLEPQIIAILSCPKAFFDSRISRIHAQPDATAFRRRNGFFNKQHAFHAFRYGGNQKFAVIHGIPCRKSFYLVSEITIEVGEGL